MACGATDLFGCWHTQRPPRAISAPPSPTTRRCSRRACAPGTQTRRGTRLPTDRRTAGDRGPDRRAGERGEHACCSLARPARVRASGRACRSLQLRDMHTHAHTQHNDDRAVYCSFQKQTSYTFRGYVLRRDVTKFQGCTLLRLAV